MCLHVQWAKEEAGHRHDAADHYKDDHKGDDQEFPTIPGYSQVILV